VAGVSIATVSRVMNGNYFVSDELHARVQKAVDELDYQPNAVARGLRRQETLTIGVLMPKLNDSFFSTFGYAVEKMLFANNYRTVFCSTETTQEKETAYVNNLLQQRVDGVIMFPSEQSQENVKRLLNEGIPVILVERELPNLPTDQVLVSNYNGGYQGIQHLLELGHREIGVISSGANQAPMCHRFQGVMDTFKEAGITPRPEHILAVDSAESRFEIGYQNTLHMFQQAARPTAIFALTDEIAVGALHATAELAIKVPDELSIIGFDNISLAAFVIPALTTVAQPIAQLGQTAAEMLLRKLQNANDRVEKITLETSVIVRQSTARPA
jgi:LacI family transcriptional regulator